MAKTLEQKLKVGMIGAQTSKEGHNTIGQSDKIISRVNRYDLDILLAPEWYFHKGVPYTKKEKERITQYIAGETDSCLILPGTFIWKDKGKLYNSTPIIADGEVKGEYHKHNECGEIKIASFFNLIPTLGEEQGKVFEWHGLKIGLEICVDHGNGCLKEGGKTELDLQIILACGSRIHNTQSAVRRKGYVLRCDGFSPIENEVRRNGILGYQDINSQWEGTIEIFEISIPLQRMY